MNFWLIQRGTFKKSPLDQISGIDSAISYDYMGSSEFEFGALGKSYNRIKKDINNYEFKTIKIKDKDFTVFMKKDQEVNAIEVFFNHKVDNPYGGLKEMLNIHRYFEGQQVSRLKYGCKKKQELTFNYGYCDFWWDISNDFWVFPKEPYNLDCIKRVISNIRDSQS